MKSVLYAAVVCLAAAMLFGCADRNNPSSITPKEHSSSSSDTAKEISSSSRSAPSRPPRSSEESDIESTEEYPAPLLTDTEQKLLAENLDLFITHLPENPVIKSTEELSKENILSACLWEIERTKELNAYIILQNDKKQDLISAELVTDTAEQLFGLQAFVFPESELYDKETNSFAYTQPEKKNIAYSASELKGAPEDNVAYTVTLENGQDYLFTCRILRQNGIPYLQLISVDEAQPASPS